MTATGMEVAASDPAGTSSTPVDFCPGGAVAVPTVKLFCAGSVAQNNTLRRKRPSALVGFIAVSSIRQGAATVRQNRVLVLARFGFIFQSREARMKGSMMDYPLTLQAILERIPRLYANVEIVSRRPDNSLHRYTYADFY